MALDWLMGSSPSLDFEQSKQQRKMWDVMFPQFKNFMQGNMPGLYDLPSPVLPNTDWYNNLAPEVRQSLWEPAQEAGQQMMEVMGAKGQLGSAGSPMSGSAATGMGKLFADYGQGIGMQAWNMTQPGLMADYQAQLGRNITGYNTSLMPYQMAAGMLPGTYGQPVINPGSQGLLGYGMQLAAPFAMGAGMGMFGNPFSGFGSSFGGGFRTNPNDPYPG